MRQPRQRVPDYYEPPTVHLWAALGSLLCALALGYVRWSGRGTG